MIRKKVILTGSFGVGKTSLFNRFINGIFKDKYLTTIGVVVKSKTVEIDGQQLSILLWDIAGEVAQDKVPVSYFLSASGIIYVFDLSRPSTFSNIEGDLEYLQNLTPNAKVKLIGNKKDLLSEAELEAVVGQIDRKIDALTSAKTGEKVDELFKELARDMIG